MVAELGLTPDAEGQLHEAAALSTQQEAIDPREAEAAKWLPIQADYESGKGTLLEVAARHGVTPQALKYRIRRDLWKRRHRSKVVNRPLIIVRMFRLLERQVLDLEMEMSEMSSKKSRSGEREVALLGKLAGNLEKLVALDLQVTKEPKRRQTKQMQDIRSKLIERIEQLRRD
jgi:hypothetical protein